MLLRRTRAFLTRTACRPWHAFRVNCPTLVMHATEEIGAAGQVSHVALVHLFGGDGDGLVMGCCPGSRPRSPGCAHRAAVEVRRVERLKPERPRAVCDILVGRQLGHRGRSPPIEPHERQIADGDPDDVVTIELLGVRQDRVRQRSSRRLAGRCRPARELRAYRSAGAARHRSSTCGAIADDEICLVQSIFCTTTWPEPPIDIGAADVCRRLDVDFASMRS